MAGIYIHIPFCAKKCSYCDFHFSTSYHTYKEELLAAIAKELKMRATNWNNEIVKTIYLGGGTPSLLSGLEVQTLLNAVEENYQLAPSLEITMECNPDDCSTENLLAWKAAGVNRLSIGIQSLTDSQLAWMNRTHTAHEGLEAVKRAKACGFDALTVDIMYGLPDLSTEEWKHLLEEVLAIGVQHISAYCLTVEAQTPLAKWVKAGTLHPSTADQQSEQFEILVETLAAGGFEQYEISNFAKDGQYSKHNTAYWLGEKYVGVGPSAHGYDGETRSWNVAHNQRYLKAIAAGELPETREVLSRYDRFNELLMVGLRTMWGVDKNELQKQLSLTTDWQLLVDGWKLKNKLVETNESIILTPAGRLLADAIAADLFVLDPDL